jgi:hypothetical protein
MLYAPSQNTWFDDLIVHDFLMGDAGISALAEVLSFNSSLRRITARGVSTIPTTGAIWSRGTIRFVLFFVLVVVVTQDSLC